MGETFSPELLTSLEGTDPSLIIKIDTPSWDQVVGDLINGIDPNDLKRYRVEAFIRRGAEKAPRDAAILDSKGASRAQLMDLKFAY